VLGALSNVKRWIQFAVSLAITLVCFWWTFKDTQWGDLWVSLQSANWLWLVPYLAILGLIHLFRTLRWGNLLSGIESVRFSALNDASAIGFMMLLILPFRLGEFARPVLISQRSKIRKSEAMTSVVLERIIDGIFIAVLLRVLLFFVPDQGAEIARVRWGGNVMFLVFFGGFIFLVLARWQEALVLRVLGALTSPISPKLSARISSLVSGFVGALRQLPDAKNSALFAIWTLLYWGANGLGVYVLSLAFDCSHASAGTTCHALTLTPFMGFVVLSVLIIGLMIPAAPGSAGTFQAFILLGLSLFVSKAAVNSSGVAFANVSWVLQIAQQIVFGLFFMTKSHGSFRDIAQRVAGGDAAASP
jgi:glycosyltransferase 2 family protein